jgi:photosystem II stability/assembly factor-like uncharacterized protein
VLSRTDSGRAFLWRSGDAGRHWSQIVLPDLLARAVAGVEPDLRMRADGHGWLAANGLWATSDGGRTWTALG